MFDTIVVPIDGTAFSLQALPSAASIASAARATVRVVTVVRDEGQRASGAETVQAAAKLLPQAVASPPDVLIHTDPFAALLDLARVADNVLCFATHDRNRLASRLMGSVGSGLIQRSPDSFIVVGPHGASVAQGREVVVAVDGAADPEPLLSIAVTWAKRMVAPLRLVTVFEPTAADLRRPDHYSREIGPSIDPDVYLDGIRARVADVGLLSVETTAVPDPVSVAGGLETHLGEHPALLLVLGAGSHRVWPPSVVSTLLKGMPPPILAVHHPG